MFNELYRSSTELNTQHRAYDLCIITAANESIIDTLNLSDNTKTNMHAGIQAGDTIITPDRFVSSGNWNGMFYVSLATDGTGTYAIGEQTQQNGGWTTGLFETLSDGFYWVKDLLSEQQRKVELLSQQLTSLSQREGQLRTQLRDWHRETARLHGQADRVRRELADGETNRRRVQWNLLKQKESRFWEKLA